MRRNQRYPNGRIPRQLPTRILVPFLLFWCLGSFALGEEISQLPLSAFASAIVRPLQSAPAAQGQIAHIAPSLPSRVVATGVLGDKPTGSTKRAGGKTAHGKIRQGASAATVPGPQFHVVAPDGVKVIALGDDGGSGWTWVALAPDAPGPWDSRARWAGTWGDTPPWAMSFGPRWAAMASTPCPLASADDGW